MTRDAPRLCEVFQALATSTASITFTTAPPPFSLHMHDLGPNGYIVTART